MLERITENSGILDGKPVIRERWIPVAQVIGRLADGFSYHDLMQAHPDMTSEDIRACLAYAYFRITDQLPHDLFSHRSKSVE
ncbi:DUF433 domain-containing protein [Halomicronema sp. CCY15110]|uniref:DUF433 domain-containing protein n=1 Tax=Halomicronema sp. CCY15110 TaxID=2767773 RepID=UPI00195206DC|nr:DUF433 domain-containing protein [Halomicronema sp. CCY15110]